MCEYLKQCIVKFQNEKQKRNLPRVIDSANSKTIGNI